MKPKPTTRQIIINLLQARGGWVNLWEFCNRDTECGFLPVTARSRAQDLAREGKIEHRLGSKDDPLAPGKYSWYKAKPIQYQTYIIRGSDGKAEGQIQRPILTIQNKLF